MTIPIKVALIADDDEFFRMALRTILTGKLGFSEVIETGSLDEAIERLAERKDITLALFDLSMPGMQSAASLRAVREHFQALRVAVVSSSQQRLDILLALEVGVHGYVPKGLGPAELVRALQLIVGGVLYIPPSVADLSSPAEERDAEEVYAVSAQQPVAETFTPRQREVLDLLVQGKSNKEIARTLQLGEGTVKVHLAALFRSMGVNTRAAAAVAGIQLLTSSQAPPGSLGR